MKYDDLVKRHYCARLSACHAQAGRQFYDAIINLPFR